MRENVTLTCVACPNGCDVTVSFNEDGSIKEITGNKCKNGIAYATSEVTAPARILTTTVLVEGGDFRLCSVKTAEPIPKQMMKDAVKELAKIKINAPVNVGDIIMKDILGTGIDVVATARVKKA